MKHSCLVLLAAAVMLKLSWARANTALMAPEIFNTNDADLEAQREQLREAPVHVQALIVDSYYPLKECSITAEIVTSFKGWETLPVGSLFKLRIPCSSALGSRVWRDRDAVHVGLVYAPELHIGRFFEAYLDHFGPPKGYRLAGFPTEQSTAPEERFAFIPAQSSSPRLAIPAAPTTPSVGPLHYWRTGHELEAAYTAQAKDPNRSPHKVEFPAQTLDFIASQDRGHENPPAFPTRYVVQTITHPARPGRQYRLMYDPETWRTRIDELNAAGQPTGFVQYGDGFADVMVDADAKTHSLLQSQNDFAAHGESWLGTGWLGLSPLIPQWKLDKIGQKTVAGVPCVVYRITDERWTHQLVDEGHLCTTSDGIILEANPVSFPSQPYTTIRVEYLKQPDRGLFDEPQGWQGRIDR